MVVLAGVLAHGLRLCRLERRRSGTGSAPPRSRRARIAAPLRRPRFRGRRRCRQSLGLRSPPLRGSRRKNLISAGSLLMNVITIGAPMRLALRPLAPVGDGAGDQDLPVAQLPDLRLRRHRTTSRRASRSGRSSRPVAAPSACACGSVRPRAEAPAAQGRRPTIEIELFETPILATICFVTQTLRCGALVPAADGHPWRSRAGPDWRRHALESPRSSLLLPMPRTALIWRRDLPALRRAIACSRRRNRAFVRTHAPYTSSSH